MQIKFIIRVPFPSEFLTGAIKCVLNYNCKRSCKIQKYFFFYTGTIMNYFDLINITVLSPPPLTLKINTNKVFMIQVDHNHLFINSICC